MVVHHSGVADKDRSRGSTALKGALDAEYRCQLDAGTKSILFESKKMKDAEMPSPKNFQITQVDLPNNSQSGLKIVQDILKEVDDISFIYLNAEDVVRNRLVGEIVTAYGNWDENISKSTFPIRSGKGDR